jgi:hypothetical protein
MLNIRNPFFERVVWAFFSGVTFFAIFKHRKGKAPSTSFFLNKDSMIRELNLFPQVSLRGY